MAGGENSAKKTLINEVDILIEKIENGEGDRQEEYGHALSLILQMFKPLYMAEYITVEQCEIKHGEITKQITPNKAIKLKLGPFEIAGSFSQTVILSMIMVGGFSGLIYVIGKTQDWW